MGIHSNCLDIVYIKVFEPNIHLLCDMRVFFVSTNRIYDEIKIY